MFPQVTWLEVRLGEAQLGSNGPLAKLITAHLLTQKEMCSKPYYNNRLITHPDLHTILPFPTWLQKYRRRKKQLFSNWEKFVQENDFLKKSQIYLRKNSKS